MLKISKYVVAALFFAALVWSTNVVEAGVLLRDCKIKTIEAYRDAIQVQLSFKSAGEEKDIHFMLGNSTNPFDAAQLALLRDALIFRKEVDVLVEDLKKKSLILGVVLSQKTRS